MRCGDGGGAGEPPVRVGLTQSSAIMPVNSNMARAFMLLVSSVAILWILSWLQTILVPIALAILLTFLLSPVVSMLRGAGIPRVFAVTFVVSVGFSLIVGVGWMLARQMTSLVDAFPHYEKNLNAKLAAFHPAEDGFVNKVQRIVGRMGRQFERSAGARAPISERKRSDRPLAVEIVENDSLFRIPLLWSALGPVMEPIAAVGFAFVLVIFMLIRREDLRDRVISIVGRGRLTLTTKALDEAGERISRFLLLQLIVNGSYGLAVAGGLFAIGVPYALLWGFVAAVFRYIPYIGAWIAALLPISLSLLISEDWSAPILVLALFLTLELISNTLVEPWLYGRGIGISETATLIMIAFWTWLWGPIGLMLATPLTVCLVVLGKYVPFLSVFDTLLGDQPALEPHIVFYQRLLARDQDEATEIAEAHLQERTLTATYDSLLVPALINARRDMEREVLSEDERLGIVRTAREVAEELVIVNDSRVQESQIAEDPKTAASHTRPAMRILGIPARDESDELGLSLLSEVLGRADYQVIVVKHGLLAADAISLVLEEQPTVVCVAAMPPGGSAQARLLCMRLRARFPDLKIVVGRWGYGGDAQSTREKLLTAGADFVGTSLDETGDQLASLRALLPAVSEPEEATINSRTEQRANEASTRIVLQNVLGLTPP
jgi:predicted PurR-regulated permease PerM/CheY-like chemotaxis protein